MLEDLRRVTAEVREHPQAFAEYLNSKQSAELQNEICRLAKENTAMQKHKAELDAIFKKLYVDSVLERSTVEQLQMLSASYTGDQAKRATTIPKREVKIQQLRETVSSTAIFLNKSKRYSDIQELTPELLRLFIRKIVTHEKEVKYSKHAPQAVGIYVVKSTNILRISKTGKQSPVGVLKHQPGKPHPLVTLIKGQPVESVSLFFQIIIALFLRQSIVFSLFQVFSIIMQEN